jgi:hypothetical protein
MLPEWSTKRKINMDSIDFHAYFKILLAVMRENNDKIEANLVKFQENLRKDVVNMKAEFKEEVNGLNKNLKDER